jgi:diguanylate cyclase
MDSSQELERSLPLRSYALRIAALGLGFVAVGTAFQVSGAHAMALVALGIHAFAWPHVAFLWARDSPDPYRAERRNLVIDAALGGAWIALMGFNLVPSLLLVSTLAMDKIGIGGPRFLAQCLLAMAVTCGAIALASGIEPHFASPLTVILACAPLGLLYPMFVGIAADRLAAYMRDQNRTLSMRVRIDALSQLLTRGAWEEDVAREFARHRRNSSKAGLLLLDLDDFKTINDRYGHASGDDAIRRLGSVLREHLRAQDVAGRYGGDEFGVLLPETDAPGSQVIAERLRLAFEAAGAEGKQSRRCTASIGIAVADAGAQSDHAQWIQHADRALYEAKANGRNRVELYRKG